MNNQDNYSIEKRELIIKDWETGFEMYNKHVAQITALRGWNLTLMLAYLGFVTSIKLFDIFLIIPMIFVIVGFFILELFEGMYMQFIGRQILKIERIFSIIEERKRNQEIDEYRFRDLELLNQSYIGKVKWAFTHAKGMRVVFWYTFLLLFSIGTFFLLKAKL